MWQSNELKDVLGLIVEKLRRKDALSMIWVCRFWRYILKRKVSTKYPIIMKKEIKNSPISWHTVLCDITPFPNFSSFNLKQLILSQETSLFDFSILPQGLKMLGLNISLDEGQNFSTIGKIPSLSHLYIKAKEFPYFLLTPETKKIEFYTKSDGIIDFNQLNVGAYTLLYIRPIYKISGDISLLTLSYESLKELYLYVENLPDLRYFSRLKHLNVKCNQMDISYLPITLEWLKIKATIIYNFVLLRNFKNIKKYDIDSSFELKNIVFPPNVKQCSILNAQFLPGYFPGTIPSSLKILRVGVRHLLNYPQLYHLNLTGLRVSMVKNVPYIFRKFDTTLSYLEIMGKYEMTSDIFPDLMNVTCLKTSAAVIELPYLPRDLQTLYLNRKSITIGAPKNPSLKISRFNYIL